MRGPLPMAVALAVLLAGCGSSPDDPTTTSETLSSTSTSDTTTATTGTPPPPPPPNAPLDAPTLTDCQEMAFGFPASPYAPDPAWFPPGFEPSRPAQDTGSAGGLLVLKCARGVLNNLTVLQDVALAAVTMGVRVDSGVPQASSQANVLVLETFSDNAQLVASLNRAGFQTKLAEISYAPSATGPDEATVGVGGQVFYKATQSSHTPSTTNMTDQARWHDWNGTAGSETWLDIRTTFDAWDSFATPAVLEATGGRLKEMADGQPATYIGAAGGLHLERVTLQYRPG